MEYEAIVLAAGNSSRSGLAYNKVLFEINGKKIIEVSTRNFILDNDCKKIIVVCKNEEIATFKKIFVNESKVSFVIGGQTRQESVSNALNVVTSDYVFIHDGARPYYTAILLNRLKSKLHDFDVVIPVWSLKDTIKVVKDNIVIKTLKRDELRLTQTPQAFKTDVIKKAHLDAKNKDYTDDSSMVEETNPSVVVSTIDGEYSNIKYTYKEDF